MVWQREHGICPTGVFSVFIEDKWVLCTGFCRFSLALRQLTDDEKECPEREPIDGFL